MYFSSSWNQHNNYNFCKEFTINALLYVKLLNFVTENLKYLREKKGKFYQYFDLNPTCVMCVLASVNDRYSGGI